MTRTHRRRRDESGQLAGIEVLPFGILVFVVGVLFFAQLWAVVSAKSSTESAAREATRTFVESSGDVGAAAGNASGAAAEVLTSAGRSSSRASIVPMTPLTLDRCATITFEVSYEVPVVALPLISWGSGFTVRSSHTEIVDPFRDGLEGAGCE